MSVSTAITACSRCVLIMAVILVLFSLLFAMFSLLFVMVLLLVVMVSVLFAMVLLLLLRKCVVWRYAVWWWVMHCVDLQP
jgi:hypothetical protein